MRYELTMPSTSTISSRKRPRPPNGVSVQPPTYTCILGMRSIFHQKRTYFFTREWPIVPCGDVREWCIWPWHRSATRVILKGKIESTNTKSRLVSARRRVILTYSSLICSAPSRLMFTPTRYLIAKDAQQRSMSTVRTHLFHPTHPRVSENSCEAGKKSRQCFC
jgi:hypothetical protein